MTIITASIKNRMRAQLARIDRTEQRLASARKQADQKAADFAGLVTAIASDSYAASFQSFAQYRRALLDMALQLAASRAPRTDAAEGRQE